MIVSVGGTRFTTYDPPSDSNMISKKLTLTSMSCPTLLMIHMCGRGTCIDVSDVGSSPATSTVVALRNRLLHASLPVIEML